MKKALIDQDCINKFVKAIQFELGHEYLYRFLSNAMGAAGYFGAAAYFLAESKEEGEHYQKHINFLNDLGALPELPVLNPKVGPVTTMEYAIKMAYTNELGLLNYYKDMYNTEMMKPEITEHLLFYIKTQRDAVGFYGDILATFESELKNQNINMVIDQKLKDLA